MIFLVTLVIFVYLVSIFTTAIVMTDHDIDMSLFVLMICFCPILNTWISIKYGEFGFKDIFKKLRKEK
jgi:hypothetical protein